MQVFKTSLSAKKNKIKPAVLPFNFFNIFFETSAVFISKAEFNVAPEQSFEIVGSDIAQYSSE